MRRLILAAAALCALAGCAGNPAATGILKTHASPSGLPLGCVPDALTQRCDQFGAWYSGDDLRRTGAQHVGQALGLVDPQIGH